MVLAGDGIFNLSKVGEIGSLICLNLPILSLEEENHLVIMFKLSYEFLEIDIELLVDFNSGSCKLRLPLVEFKGA